MYLTKDMARFGVFTRFLLLSFAAFLLASDSSLINAPQSHRAGVFMIIEGGDYTFNFTAATAACLFLNTTIATIAQMERAVQHGLEICKYGWTAEQIAVIPRLTADQKCGKGKTGVVEWRASPDKKFGVFCFNASAETPDRSTATPGGSTFSTTLTALIRTSTPAVPLLGPTTGSPPPRQPRTTTAPQQTSVISAFTLKTTHSTGNPSTSISLKTTPRPTSLPHLKTLKPTAVSFAFSTSVHAYNFSASTESAMLPAVHPTKPSLGDTPTALIILGVILLLLTAAGVVWYYKLHSFSFWPQGRQKDDIETEMWKHTDSEMDLHSQHEGEEEELDRKYSSDITLCVKPDIKTNFSE